MFNKQNRSASSSLIPLDKLEWRAFFGKDSEKNYDLSSQVENTNFSVRKHFAINART